MPDIFHFGKSELKDIKKGQVSRNNQFFGLELVFALHKKLIWKQTEHEQQSKNTCMC